MINAKIFMSGVILKRSLMKTPQVILKCTELKYLSNIYLIKYNNWNKKNFLLMVAMTRILVVEDNPMNMELVTFLLQSNGLEVIQAVDGIEALERVKNSIFDLVLLDIQLPGMDGLDILKKMRENPALQQMPVVALTAHAMQGDERKFIDAGCIGYISKPIDVFGFMEKVNSFLKQQRV